MTARARPAFPALACLLLATLAGCTDGADGGYDLDVSPEDFREGGIVHPFLPLQVGSVWEYEAEADDGTRARTVEVLDETRDVNGVNATVVQETSTRDGEVLEQRRVWYAQARDGTVWLLGVEGSWAWGVDGARPGIAMPSEPQAGASYHTAYAPGEVERRAAVVDLGRRVEVPFGTFEDTVTTRTWSDLEQTGAERVQYARGVGEVLREPEDIEPAVRLVSYEPG